MIAAETAALVLSITAFLICAWLTRDWWCSYVEDDGYDYEGPLAELDVRYQRSRLKESEAETTIICWLHWESFGGPTESYLMDQGYAAVKLPNDALARLCFRWHDAGWSLCLCRWDDASDNPAFGAHEMDAAWRHIVSTDWPKTSTLEDRVPEYQRIARQVLGEAARAAASQRVNST